MSLSIDNVLNALKNVQDPDLHKDLVSLNMIEDVKVDGHKVSFSIVLTTPSCPMKNLMKADAVAAVTALDPDAEVEVNLTSRVTTRRGLNEELLRGVKNIIAVASGKGGVGKSTVAANLAISLARQGSRVGLLDADIHGPSVPMMFGLVDQKPAAVDRDGKVKIVPIEKFGIKLLSIGFFVDASKALIWRGPMASSALMQLFNDSEWGELDYFVLDLPPGTGDIHLTLAQQVPVTGIAVVTTPQEVALADARKALSMFNTEAIRIPVLGIIENMAWFSPPELPENKYYIFGKEGGKRLAEEAGIPLLGQIPIIESIRESGDEGLPVALHDDSPVALAFNKVAETIAQQIAIRNAFFEAMDPPGPPKS